MKPIDQTRFGDPGGNCYQAALASILELPLEDVPDFCNMRVAGGDSPLIGEWAAELNKWLHEYGLFAIEVDCAGMEWLTDNAFVLASVKSVTTPEATHCVVYRKGCVVHDPHPARAHMDAKPLSFDVFVATDPALARVALCP